MANTQTSSSDHHIRTVSVTDESVDLPALHAHVLQRNARVELVNGSPDSACVLISKCELQGLERALEILAGTDDVRAMCAELARIIVRSGEPTPSFLGAIPSPASSRLGRR